MDEQQTLQDDLSRVWLPAWQNAEALAAPGINVSVAHSDGRRALLCSTNPVYLGMALRAAANHKTIAVIFGNPGSSLRRQTFGGTVQSVVPFPKPSDRLKPWFDELNKALRTAPNQPVMKVPEASREDLMYSLANLEGIPSNAGGTTARFLRQRAKQRKATGCSVQSPEPSKRC